MQFLHYIPEHEGKILLLEYYGGFNFEAQHSILEIGGMSEGMSVTCSFDGLEASRPVGIKAIKLGHFKKFRGRCLNL